MTGTKEQFLPDEIAGQVRSTRGDAPGTSADQTKRRAAFYSVFAIGALAAAAYGGWTRFPAASLKDVFSGSDSPYDAILCAGGVLLPILFEFLAVYVFASSPFCMTACLGALFARGMRFGAAARAIYASGSFKALDRAAVIMWALGALALALFCAGSFALSPELRRITFSSFDGRRAASAHTLRFLTLSGAAALMTLAPAIIIHLA